MRCEDGRVDKFECPSASVLYHYPSLEIDRSHLKKEFRCHAFTALAGALSPLAGSGATLSGFTSHHIEDRKPLTSCAPASGGILSLTHRICGHVLENAATFFFPPRLDTGVFSTRLCVQFVAVQFEQLHTHGLSDCNKTEAK